MGFIGDALSAPMSAIGGLMGGGGSSGGGGLGGMLGGLPIVGGLLGGGGQGQAQQPQRAPQGGQSQWSGWPVPGPGAQPTYDFKGDLSGPGAAEGYFADNKDKFGAPTATSQYWGQNQQKFGQPGQGDQFWNQAQGMFNTQKPGSNNAQTAFDQFQSSAPANTDPYYKHAIDATTAHLNNQAGARGQFNSTGALQTIGDATANLRGQQAQADAQYGLNRGQVAGSLGSAADTSSRGINQNQLGWMQGLGSLGLGLQNSDLQRLMTGMNAAGGVDQTSLAQLMAGMGAANTAQGALASRGQNYFNNLNQLGGQQAGILGNTYGAMLGNDQQLFNDQQAALLGLPREQLNQSLNGRASTEEGIGNLAGLAGSFMGGMI
jgi:hypothetical protein